MMMASSDRVAGVEEDELLGHARDPLFTPTKFSLGYIYAFHCADYVKLGIGALGSRAERTGGSDPTSFTCASRFECAATLYRNASGGSDQELIFGFDVCWMNLDARRS